MHLKLKALRLCSAYFFTMFAASVFVNIACIQPTVPTEAPAELLQSYLERIEKLELENRAAQIDIAADDLTGLITLVEKKRARTQEKAQRELARAERLNRNSENLTKTVAATQTIVKTYAAAAPVADAEDDPHPNAGHYSKTFVPMDKDIEALPVKYAQESERYSESDIRNTIIGKAKAHLGTKYVWAGKKPGGFDCSGFTSYMMSQYGINVSPSSRHQGLQGDYCKISDAQTGDLVFFSKYGKGGRITHVALVVENTGHELYVIHACSRGIVIDNILNDKYWTPKILYARNVISPKAKAAKMEKKADKKAEPQITPAETAPAAPTVTEKI